MLVKKSVCINFFPSLLYQSNMSSFPTWNVSKATWAIFIFSASWHKGNIDSYLHRGIGGKGWQALLFCRDGLLLQLLMIVKITTAGWSLTIQSSDTCIIWISKLPFNGNSVFIFNFFFNLHMPKDNRMHTKEFHLG